MNFNKTLVIPALVFSILLPACQSYQNAAGTPTRLGPAESPQPSATLVVTPTAPILPGTSPENPAPIGYAVHADNMKIVVSGMVRPANGLVASGSMFNSQPGGHEQYILVSLQITCEQPLDQPCHLNIVKMTVLGSDGILNYPERLVTGVDNVLVSTDLNRGAVITGNVPFIISIGDSRLSLVYESRYGEMYYLALP